MFYRCAISSIPFPHLNMETYKGKKKKKKSAYYDVHKNYTMYVSSSSHDLFTMCRTHVYTGAPKSEEYFILTQFLSKLFFCK